MPTSGLIDRPGSVRTPVNSEQARFMSRLIRELLEAFDRSRDKGLRRLSEYQRFIEGAGACGFVCNDIAPKYLSPYQERPELLHTASFSVARRYLHTLVRAEVHQDPELPDAMLPVFVALRSGALATIASRLNGDSMWFGS